MSTHNFEGNYPPPTTLSLPIAHPPSSDMAGNLQDDFLLADFDAGDFKANMNSPLAFAAPGLGGGPGTYSPEAPGTVSPKDLMFPPSATYTDMSTPSFASSFASPGSYSQGPSPMFQDVDTSYSWDDPLLFGDSAGPLESPATDAVPMAQNSRGRFAMSPPSKPAASTSSPISATGTGKISSVAGVTKRGAPKPLPPVQFNPDDPDAARRARNTEAARRSRAKKAEALADAEKKAENLEAQLAEALDELAKRDAEIARLKAQLGAL